MRILRMCCSYAETRPGQQEAYEHLKKHLDKAHWGDGVWKGCSPGILAFLGSPNEECIS